MGYNLRKRLVLLFAAALIVVIVLVYPSLGCKISGDQIKASPVKPFVIIVREGYAIGFTFNLTNLGGCEATAESIQVDLRTAVHADGRVTDMHTTESESLRTALPPGQTKMFSYSLDSYLQFRPAKLDLRIEISFGDAGRVTVFDGELPIPQK